MLFKIKDYNAFLTFIYEKTSRQMQNTQQTHSPQTSQVQAPLVSHQQAQVQSHQLYMRNQSLSPKFPVDFDFGLIPAAAYTSPTDPTQNPELGFPDQNFDLFGPPGSRSQNQPASTRVKLESLDQLQHPSTQPDYFIKQEYETKFFGDSTPMQDTLMDIGGAGEYQLNVDRPPVLTKTERGSNNNIPYSSPRQVQESSTNQTSQSHTKGHLGTEYEYSLPSSSKYIPRGRAKSSHNVIEQRYRNKINDRFTTLQNSVPTLRIVTRRSSNRDTDGDIEAEEEEDDHEYSNSLGYTPENLEDIDLEGLEPARKLSKGTILAKSVEYIKFLETKNNRLKMQQEELLARARMLGLSIEEEDLCIS